MRRYTDEELLKLLNDTESDHAQRKQSFKGDTPAKARQAVCAFANDLSGYNEPGVLFIGANDDGTPSREPVTEQLLLSLANMKTDGNILPMPVLSVEKRVLKDAEMAVVTVMPSDMPPVKYEGRIWIRTGPRRALANEQEERILNEKRRYKNLPFDLFPIPIAQLSDLSRLVFESEFLPAAFAPDVLEENGRSYEQRLASCKMIVSPNDTTPTVLGILAIGKSPQDFLPGAYIQFLRIDGVELADPVVDEEEIGGAVVEMLRRIEEKLRSHNRTAIDITSKATHEIDQPYPIAALQQIVYNAVFHRTYERTNAPIRVYWFNDRIEITSPGGPYGNVTTENFGEPGITDYRNPNIGGVLKTFGFIQSFGRVLAVDLDPQSNLTAAFLDEEKIEKIWENRGGGTTIFNCVRPLTGVGDIEEPALQQISNDLYLIPGDVELSSFEDILSTEWPNSMSDTNLYRPMRILSSFWQVMQMGAKKIEADIILVDIGPNLGAINRSVLVATD